MIAGFHPANARAHGFNNAGAFVAWHHRQRVLGSPGHQVPVAMAHAGRGDFNQNFAGVGTGEINGFNGKGFVYFI